MIIFNTVILSIFVWCADSFTLPKPYRWIDNGQYICKHQQSTNTIESEIVVSTLHDGTIIYQSCDKKSFFYIIEKHTMDFNKKENRYSYNAILNDSERFVLQKDDAGYSFFEKKMLNGIPTVDELNAPYILDEVKVDESFRRFMSLRKALLNIACAISCLNIWMYVSEISSLKKV